MALHMVFREFKENCKVKNAIINYSRKQNEFLIYVYCLQKDINITNEKKNKLKTLCYKHGISFEYEYGQSLWELPTLSQIISTTPTYSSAYVFSFKKKKGFLFFCYNNL